MQESITYCQQVKQEFILIWKFLRLLISKISKCFVLDSRFLCISVFTVSTILCLIFLCNITYQKKKIFMQYNGLVESNQSIVQIPKQFKSQVTIQEEMNINRRTISEITKIMWDSDNEVRRKKTLNNHIVSLTLLYVL